MTSRTPRARHPATVTMPGAEPAGDGLVVVDKPPEWTSHDVVGRMRRLAGTRKVGHAGTLDPMATGVLVLGVSRATRLLTYLVGADKEYTATIRLGQNTLTDDAQGEVTHAVGAADPAQLRLRLPEQIASLTGAIDQVPSAVSAIKIDGQRAYRRVRAGEQVDLPARAVTVHRFEIGELHPARAADGTPVADLEATITCSSGTYIRALARDLGAALGTGGHLTRLRRDRVGPFVLEDAATLAELAERFTLTGVSDALRALFPPRQLTEAETRAVRYGQQLAATGTADVVAAFSPHGRGIALLQDDGDRARPVLVLDPA